MKTKIILASAFSFLLFILSCSSQNTVKVTAFEPTGEVKNLTTFTVEFSQDLAPADSLNKWLDDEFIQFEPKIVGKFKWTSERTLIFSPDIPLEPIQKYSARITNKILFNKKLSLDEDTYVFNTAKFGAYKAEYFWSHIPNEKFKVSVKANIYFNYSVNPDMLKDFLKVESEGKEIKDFQILTENTSDIIAISIGNVDQTNEKQEYKITVKKGLMSVAGKEATGEDKEFKYDLSPITQLTIYGVNAGFDGQKGWIEVSTSQMVDEKRLKDFVQTDKIKNASFFVTENTFRIEGDIDITQSVKLLIKKGLPGLYGGELENEFEQDVNFVNLNPTVSFADRSGRYLMLGGQRNLMVNAVNVPGVDIQVTHVFKNNIVHFLNHFSRRL
jgi:alpha-2-macroglobulin